MSDFSDSEFQGKVAAVTGAGGGIGRCHAIEFAKRGAKVVVNDLGGSVDGTGSGDAADAVVAEIEALGGTAVANKGSVSDREGAKSIVDDAISAFGRIDILVNNAGILRDRTFKNMTLDEFDLVMDVHLTGTAYVTHAAWPHMYEQRYGRVVFTSSGSGIFGNFGQSNYGAAKMGMLGLANVLALEGANRNVRVNVLGPGAATRMTNTVPGRDENLAEPDPNRHPALVSPGSAVHVQRGRSKRRGHPCIRRQLPPQRGLGERCRSARSGGELRGSAAAYRQAAGHVERAPAGAEGTSTAAVG